MGYVITIVIVFAALHALCNLLFLVKVEDVNKETKKAVVDGLKAFLILVASCLVIKHVWDEGRQALMPMVTCQEASQHQKRSCLINHSLTAPLKAASETGVVGMHLCIFPEGKIESQRFVNDGGTFWRFKVKEKGEEILMTYKLMKACPKGEIP